MGISPGKHCRVINIGQHFTGHLLSLPSRTSTTETGSTMRTASSRTPVTHHTDCCPCHHQAVATGACLHTKKPEGGFQSEDHQCTMLYMHLNDHYHFLPALPLCLISTSTSGSHHCATFLCRFQVHLRTDKAVLISYSSSCTYAVHRYFG